MKKLFAILAIAGFVACNDTASTTTAADSTKIADSLKAAVEAANKMMPADTAANKMVDSTKTAVDTAAKKMETKK